LFLPHMMQIFREEERKAEKVAIMYRQEKRK
jgi:hypothetical protein